MAGCFVSCTAGLLSRWHPLQPMTKSYRGRQGQFPVVAGCYTGIRPPVVQAQFPEVLTALDFFHVPEKLWPTALKVLPRVKALYDKATATAQRLVKEMLEGGFEGAWLNNDGIMRKEGYALCKSDDGLLKLQYKDSFQELCNTESPVVVDTMLEATLQNVAAIYGLQLDICFEEHVRLTYIGLHVFAVAD